MSDITDIRTVALRALPITGDAFAPYGTLIESIEDGQPFGGDQARLVLDRGTPRFYIMTLHRREKTFGSITRHMAVTQCLASVGGKPWYIVVAPPDAPDDAQAKPDVERMQAFRIEGDQAIMLARSTWHAGPFFDDESVGFFNLELADTNQVDHHDCDLEGEFGVRVTIVP